MEKLRRILCLSLLSASRQASAEEPAATPASPMSQLSLEELMEVEVSTVSRIDERIDESPGNVYVFPRSVIQNLCQWLRSTYQPRGIEVIFSLDLRL